MRVGWLLMVSVVRLAAQTMALPAGGTVHFKDLNGELVVEGWDRADVEITAAKNAPVKMQVQGSELVIASNVKHRAHQEYRIHMPRNAKLVVEHRDGEVHVADVAGDIRATVRRGEIVLRMPASGQYSVDAHSKWGDIVSDFPQGAQSKRRWWITGHRMDTPRGPAGTHQLYLRAGFGDLLILKELQPAPLVTPAQ